MVIVLFVDSLNLRIVPLTLPRIHYHTKKIHIWHGVLNRIFYTHKKLSFLFLFFISTIEYFYIRIFIFVIWALSWHATYWQFLCHVRRGHGIINQCPNATCPRTIVFYGLCKKSSKFIVSVYFVLFSCLYFFLFLDK